MKISICATPKPFKDHIGKIQEEAIKSWVANKDVEVILCGEEEGTKEMVKKYKTKHLPSISYNGFGTPILEYIIERIQNLVDGDLICYTSADMLLTFKRPINIKENFLGLGYRYDMDIDKPKIVTKHNASACDYWIFPKGMWKRFPAFTVGRGAQEGWMIWYCQRMGIPVIDLTNQVKAIHQNHDYSHLSNKKGWDKSVEFKRNIDLAGGFFHLRTLRDVDLVLENGQIVKKELTVYKLLFGNPIGQWVLGFKRLIHYYL